MDIPSREVAMPTEQQIQGLITVCVSRMAAYFDARRTSVVRAEVIAEIQDLARLAGEWGLCGKEAEERIVRPVEARLIERYGHELGCRLYQIFTRTYDAGACEVAEPDGRGVV